VPLQNLLDENYGEYIITLTLGNNDFTEEYDKITFPNIEYGEELYTPAIHGYSFENKGVAPGTLTGGIDENGNITEGSKWEIFNETFNLEGISEARKKGLFNAFGLNKNDAFSGGSCYGMSESSLMEFKYSDYDQFLEDQGKSTIFEFGEPSGWLRWNGGREEGPSPVLKHILKFQLSWYGIPDPQNNIIDYSGIYSWSEGKNPRDLLNTLGEDLQNKMYVLAIGDYTFNVKASFFYSPGNPAVGEEITFNASASKSYIPNGEIVSYEWDWDNDGNYDNSTTDPVITLFPTEEGEYIMRLRVTDNEENQEIVEGVINVKEERDHLIERSENYEQEGSWAHALVPYDVDEEENKIYVYDPNHPNDENWWCEIYLGNDNWEWKCLKEKWPWPEYWSSKDAVAPFIEIIPIDILHNGGELLRPIGVSGETEATFFLDGEVNLLLTNPEGRSTGIKGGSFITEAPGIRTITPVPEGNSSWKQAYYSTDDIELKTTIKGIINDSNYSLMKFGPDYFAEISDISIQEEAVDNITFSSDSVNISISEDQDSKTYDLVLNKETDDTVQTFDAIDISIMGGVTHHYLVDWDVLSQGEEGVTLQIDVDGDGVFEKTVVADNELTYDEFILQTETIIDSNPNTLNLKDKGKFVTTYIELPEGYEINQIDISSILLNKLISALLKPTEIGDYDSDGIPDLMVKFDKSEVQAILSPGEEVNLILTGKVLHNGDYIDFKGFDVIRVINQGKGKK